MAHDKMLGDGRGGKQVYEGDEGVGRLRESKVGARRLMNFGFCLKHTSLLVEEIAEEILGEAA